LNSDKHFDPNEFQNKFILGSSWLPPNSAISKETLKAISDISDITANATRNRKVTYNDEVFINAVLEAVVNITHRVLNYVLFIICDTTVTLS
jgi:hypothetical protein